MDNIGLTLRSKSRRARPQISNPKPISGPLPANKKGAAEHDPDAIPKARPRPPTNDTTSDLVKRRYSTRFNQVPDFDAKAPPVPSLPQEARDFGAGRPQTGRIPPLPDPHQRIPIDLNALQDPSLPADKCESAEYPLQRLHLFRRVHHLTRSMQTWPSFWRTPRKKR